MTITVTISALSITELEEQVSDLHRRFQATGLAPDRQAAAADMDPPRRGRSRTTRARDAGSGGSAGGVSPAPSEGAAEPNTANAPDLFAGEGAGAADDSGAESAPVDPVETASADVAGEPEPDAAEQGDETEAGAGEQGAGEGVGGEPESVEGEPAPVTTDQLVAAGRALAAAKGFDAVGAVMSKYGITRMSDCPEDKAEALLADFEGAM